MWRILRMGILLAVLLVVAQGAWLARSRTTDWKDTLRVVVYPVNADGSATTAAYIAGLQQRTFEPIAEFVAREAATYSLQRRQPVELYLAPARDAVPPPPPHQAGMMEAMFWSLRMRFWAWRNDGHAGPKAHVRLFVLFHSPETHTRLAHSVGLRQGLLAVANVFATQKMEASNNVVIAHELLHTFGATDKYDIATNRPRYPDGYAEPNASPLHPQRKAEIMAGRIPVSDARSEIPEGFDQVVIGPATAREINWQR